MVSTSEEIKKRAKQMDYEVRFGSDRPKKDEQLDILVRYVQILETKLNILSDKMDSLMEANRTPVNQTHERMLEMLWDWRSTSDLASLMGYSQEHVSREISKLRKTGALDERREGKKIFYKRAE